MNINLMTNQEKLIFIRKLLNARQKDLARNNITREFISMVESGKRNMSRDVAIDIMRNAIEFAKEKEVELNYDEEFIARTKEEDLCVLCEKLPDIKESFEKCDYIVNFGKEQGMSWTEVYATKKKGNIYVVNHEYDKAEAAYRKCLNLIDSIGSNKLKHEIYNNLGLIKDRCLKYYDAVMYYQEALKYCYINNDFIKKDRITYNIGLTYYNIGNYEKSMDTLQLLMDDKCEQTSYYYKGNMIQGVILYKLKRTSEALKTLLNLVESRNLDNSFLIRAYNNIALCYIDKKEYKKAEEFFDKAIETAKETDRVKHEILGDKGNFYFELKKYEEAKIALNESIKISEEIGSYKYQLEGLKILYEISNEENNEKEMEEILLKLLSVANNTSSKDEVIWAMKRLLDLAVKQKDINKIKIFNDYIKD
ncbi:MULTISPECIES: tetratricopeptide repeat protein [Clostridium]|nr:tetratricopeptide repeat protein [Clostridium cadaveris]MDU4953725.1 tetratricopeptide repeat protein [Clostridium sp.]MDY4947804.1 tetratricopeptide repeat protein [Clostridium cadaveris]NME66196.1 tetratricopeptide repeat protein [Clostridium cadaveris]NWK12825.1 tetratricopeptide repeat protein [Clostridium cadaveris]